VKPDWYIGILRFFFNI